MNTVVTATDMTVKAKASGSLVISKTTTFAATNTTVSFESEAYELYPAKEQISGLKDNTSSHADLAESASGLVAIANGSDIDPATGYIKNDKTEYYMVAEDAATSSAAGYYFDYVMYIAAEGTDEINTGKLYLNTTALASTVENALKATSIRILVNDVYKDTINLKDANSDVELVDCVANPIPACTPNVACADAIKITLRVFIDGALADDAAAGKAYVRNSAVVDLSKDVSFDVKFENK